ncbi:MAG: methionine synthase [Acidobacteria bacterium]|nr:MAG: methionine synthase [Acidobacteriota bacterium]
MANFLEVAREKTIIFDGAMGTQLQVRNLGADDFWGQEGFNEILNLSRPDVLREIHADYFDAGADVVETNTFGAFSIVLADYDAVDQAFELNRAGAAIAKEVAGSYSDRPRFVSGSIGPGTKLASLGQATFADLEAAYEVQVSGLLEGGVDLLQIETCQDLLQCKAAVAGAERAFESAGRRVPVIVQVTIETTGTMLLGSEIGAAIVALEPLAIDFIGLNCATGPSEMVEHVRVLSEQSPKMITVLPNAGLPEIGPDGPQYTLTPAEFVDFHKLFVTEFGVTGVGGCCGTTPEFIRALSDALGGSSPAPRSPELPPSVSSLYSPVTMEQQTSFLVVGERTNANGSKKFRELMLESDWDGCLQVARDQIQEGAHLLDVCVDYVGRDGSQDMAELAGRLATQSTIPLVLDSTEPAVIEAGISRLGGRSVINSINLEDGGAKLERLCGVAKKFGAACVALLIDEDGQARDLEWKLRVAHRIYDRALECGLRPQDLIFDALTFPLSSGQEELRRDGIATIEAVRRIKEELPGVFTILGVSNCSFGLNPASRQVLNSVFLHEAIGAGLDAAIVNAAKILPLNRIPEEQQVAAADLIYDRRSGDYDPLVGFISLFENVAEQASAAVDRSTLPVEERLRDRIINGDRNGIEADLDEALVSHAPLEVINEILLPAMKVVGDLFGSGQMQLPFVLQSAECMKSAVAHIEPHLERAGGRARGKVVLATVKGDVHDIGKNLVDIILSNNGFETINLGIKVPVSDVIKAMQENEADVIGLSGLLVKSTQIMKEDLEELNRLGLSSWPVILGGAALTRTYVEADLRKVYEGPLYYGKDAFEGLSTVEALVSGEVARPSPAGESRSRLGQARRDPVKQASAGTRRSNISADNPIPEPPFLGSRVVKGIPIDEIAPYLNETALFRNQWQLRPGDNSPEEYQVVLDEVARPALRRWIDESKRESLLAPQVVYGYWPAKSSGDDLIVFTDDSESELVRFTFPRQTDEPHLCISDFFRSDTVDYLSAFIVTMGSRVSERTRELFESDNYQDYLYLHGLSVEITEALAEYWHKRIREEWGIAGDDASDVKSLFRQGFQGGRYSFGYPACPDLEDQVQLFELLQPGRIGVDLSEGFQLHPEQSVSAIVCHHPEAKYFIVR